LYFKGLRPSKLAKRVVFILKKLVSAHNQQNPVLVVELIQDTIMMMSLELAKVLTLQGK